MHPRNATRGAQTSHMLSQSMLSIIHMLRLTAYVCHNQHGQIHRVASQVPANGAPFIGCSAYRRHGCRGYRSLTELERAALPEFVVRRVRVNF